MFEDQPQDPHNVWVLHVMFNWRAAGPKDQPKPQIPPPHTHTEGERERERHIPTLVYVRRRAAAHCPSQAGLTFGGLRSLTHKSCPECAVISNCCTWNSRNSKGLTSCKHSACAHFFGKSTISVTVKGLEKGPETKPSLLTLRGYLGAFVSFKVQCPPNNSTGNSVSDLQQPIRPSAHSIYVSLFAHTHRICVVLFVLWFADVCGDCYRAGAVPKASASKLHIGAVCHLHMVPICAGNTVGTSTYASAAARAWTRS